jgi:hypothetical protein
MSPATDGGALASSFKLAMQSGNDSDLKAAASSHAAGFRAEGKSPEEMLEALKNALVRQAPMRVGDMSPARKLYERTVGWCIDEFFELHR